MNYLSSVIIIYFVLLCSLLIFHLQEVASNSEYFKLFIDLRESDKKKKNVKFTVTKIKLCIECRP